MTQRNEPIEIDESVPGELAQMIGELSGAGSGWLNVLPIIPDGVDVPATPNALAVFSKRGPFVPLATWTPARVRRGAVVEPSQIGLQHGQGAPAAPLLADSRAPVPPEWRVLTDHPRRGFVVALPANAEPEATARWIFAALGRLCVPPRTPRFIVHRYR